MLSSFRYSAFRFSARFISLIKRVLVAKLELGIIRQSSALHAAIEAGMALRSQA